MATAPETLVDALALLAEEGYADDLRIAEGLVVCHVCEAAHRPGELRVERQFRFEGASDPSDESIVVGVRCPSCGATGRISAAYGPDMAPAVADVLRALPTAVDAADP